MRKRLFARFSWLSLQPVSAKEKKKQEKLTKIFITCQRNTSTEVEKLPIWVIVNEKWILKSRLNNKGGRPEIKCSLRREPKKRRYEGKIWKWKKCDVVKTEIANKKYTSIAECPRKHFLLKQRSNVALESSAHEYAGTQDPYARAGKLEQRPSGQARRR